MKMTEKEWDKYRAAKHVELENLYKNICNGSEHVKVPNSHGMWPIFWYLLEDVEITYTIGRGFFIEGTSPADEIAGEQTDTLVVVNKLGEIEYIDYEQPDQFFEIVKTMINEYEGIEGERNEPFKI